MCCHGPKVAETFGVMVALRHLGSLGFAAVALRVAIGAPAFPDASLTLVPLWSLDPDAVDPVATLVSTPPEPAELTIAVTPAVLATDAAMIDPTAFDEAESPFATEGIARASGVGVVNFDAGALTTLSDGGLRLGPSRPAGLAPSTATDRFHAGLVESGEAEFQFYSVDMRLTPVREGPLKLSLATGVRAIRADLSREHGGGDTPGFTAVPVVGTDIRWEVSPAAYFSGTALTQFIDATGDVLDLKAEAGISFTRKIDFAVGYQYLRSTIDAGPRNATLEQEGPFARLRISF